MRLKVLCKEIRKAKMNPSTDIRKPLRARKTMTPSSRKQVDALKEMKRRCGTGLIPNDAQPNHVGLEMVERNSVIQRSPRELSCNSEPASLPQPLKQPLNNLVVNSVIHIFDGCPEEPKDPLYNRRTTDSGVQQLLGTGTLQDVLFQLCRKESERPVVKPVEVHLTSPPPLHHQDYSAVVPKEAVSALERVAKTEGGHVSSSIPEANFYLQKRHVSSSTAPDETRRKRKNSGSGEDTFSKHTRKSHEGSRSSTNKTAMVAKLKRFIHKQLDASMADLDHQIQSLNERISHTHCLRKHEEITIKIVKRISRLDKRINGVIEGQRTELSKKASLQSHNKVPNSTTTTTTTSLLRDASGKSATPSPKPPSNGHQTLPKPADGSDDVFCLGEINPSPDMQALKPADVQQKGNAVNIARPTKPPPDSKNAVLIDLTDEPRLFNQDKEAAKQVPERRPSALENQASVSPQPSLKRFSEVAGDFSHLPPLPKIRLEPEPARGYLGTLPPQKLELSVVQLEKPKGIIALQWNISHVDLRCAPIESFHVFICREHTQKDLLLAWDKMSQIKAMPLPMACSLSQILNATKCYFTMQSRDIYGRYGPFCDIQSIILG